MKLNENLKHLRTKIGLTQEQVAKKLGVSFQAVSKWETGANFPDISMLPAIALLFDVTIDTLFSDVMREKEYSSALSEYSKNDDVIRVVQIRNGKVLTVSDVFSKDYPPIEIVFPRDCNSSAAPCRIEVFGHLLTDCAINGDVVCHQSINAGVINGDVHCDGSVQAVQINAGQIVCHEVK